MSASLSRRVAAPPSLIDRADPHRSAPPRPRSASPWPWSPPPAVPLWPGEQLLWQGGPTMLATALRLYHVRAVAIYGAVLTLADIAQAKLMGQTALPALEAAIPGTLTTLGALGIFTALAWCSTRTTRYALTSERVIMQCGVALPKTIGMPLRQIDAVAVRVRGDGTGDITLRPKPGSTLRFLKLWPFVRPWHVRAPEPMMREVQGAGWVAGVLSRAVAAAAAADRPADRPADCPAGQTEG